MVRRLRLANGEPIAVMTNYLPVRIAPSRAELEADGLYDCLRGRGVKPRIANQRIGARSASAPEARMLDEAPRAALLTMERTAFDEAGAAVEFGQHIYRASRYSFDTTLLRGLSRATRLGQPGSVRPRDGPPACARPRRHQSCTIVKTYS